MKSKILGGVLLIIGTSLGAGMLALPLVTAAGGYLHSFWLFIAMWLLTVFAAFLLLEVTLWLPEDTNLISMARATLGWPGCSIAWLLYLLLLYSLLSAYISGGSDLLHGILASFHINIPRWLDAIMFTATLGAIVYYDIVAVDWTNRALMIVKMSAYVLLIILIASHVQVQNLWGGHFGLLSSAVMVIVTSFGYSVIIPSLRRYFHSDVNALRLTIILGSLGALLCYLAWDFVVQGSISSYGVAGLIHIALSDHATSELTAALSTQLGNQAISGSVHIFTSVCVTTSFLGVSLCLSDFLTDGMQIRRHGWHRWLVMGVTFLPPLMIVVVYPSAFIAGLRYAGLFCVLLLILMPALMVWSGRYVKRIAKGYQVWGGSILLSCAIFISAALFIYGIIQL